MVIPLHDVLYSTGQTVLLENLAMGRPVIVSDVSVVRDYISPAVATAVPPEDVDALRGALDEEWSEYVAASVEWVRLHFDERRFARDIAKLCRDLMQVPDS